MIMRLQFRILQKSHFNKKFLVKALGGNFGIPKKRENGSKNIKISDMPIIPKEYVI